ncbi:MAG TPA: CehA/McbA family metallohydrolase [Acidobacteriota bacterium]|nr:CehA/McbA family metallohydrolase [Acidobacteriota bacterium]
MSESEEALAVRLLTVDAESGAATPARLEVRGEEGTFYVAEDALRVGPDQLINHGDEPPSTPELQEHLSRLSRRINNLYMRSEQFYCAGGCQVRLPRGRYRVRAFKGLEYRVAEQELAVDGSQPASLELRLSRWVNMPQQGWYSADDHLHIPRPLAALNSHIVTWMQAEDLHVANLLQWGHSRHFHNAVQYAHGEAGHYQSEGHILASGQENPRTPFLGHTIMLGTREPIYQSKHYLVYRHSFEEGRRQGTVNGYAHQGTIFHAQNGLALDLPTGLIDFLEVLQFNTVDYSVWYTALNSGFRLVPLAGTDYPVGPIPGWERFYAEVEGELTFESWLEAVRQGRVFVTNGPMLSLRVEDRGMGQELLLPEPGPVRIEGSVRFNGQRDDVERLELVENGLVVETFLPQAEEGEIGFSLTRPVEQAGWLALRASGLKSDAWVPPMLMRQAPHSGPSGEQEEGWAVAPALAHSAPVYVNIRGLPSLTEKESAREMMWVWLSRLRDLEHTLRHRLHELADDESDPTTDAVRSETLRQNREALLEAVREVEALYLERMRR